MFKYPPMRHLPHRVRQLRLAQRIGILLSACLLIVMVKPAQAYLDISASQEYFSYGNVDAPTAYYAAYGKRYLGIHPLAKSDWYYVPWTTIYTDNPATTLSFFDKGLSVMIATGSPLIMTDPLAACMAEVRNYVWLSYFPPSHIDPAGTFVLNPANTPDGVYRCGYKGSSSKGAYILNGLPYTAYLDLGLPIVATTCPVIPTYYPTIPYDYNAVTNRCERMIPQPEQYTLTLNAPAGDLEPTGTTATGNLTSKAMSVYVANQLTKQPKAGAMVRVTLDVVAGSGGHAHNDARPKGTLVDAPGCTAVAGITGNYDCTTGADGYAKFTFQADQVSGTHTISAACTNVPCINYSQSAVVDVKVAGLSTIPASPFYAFVGGTALHSDNHYLTPQAETILNGLAISYAFESQFKVGGIAPLPLTLNDASLTWGGLLDINGNWAFPHVEHRRGTAIDIRANQAAGSIPKSKFDKFEGLLQAYAELLNQQIDFIRECTKDKKSTPALQRHNRTPDNYCVSQLDGSEDPNRHYHVRLMGVKE